MKCTLDVVWIYTRLNIFFQISAELDLMYLVIFHDWFDNKKKGEMVTVKYIVQFAFSVKQVSPSLILLWVIPSHVSTQRKTEGVKWPHL